MPPKDTMGRVLQVLEALTRLVCLVRQITKSLW